MQEYLVAEKLDSTDDDGQPARASGSKKTRKRVKRRPRKVKKAKLTHDAPSLSDDQNIDADYMGSDSEASEGLESTDEDEGPMEITNEEVWIYI